MHKSLSFKLQSQSVNNKLWKNYVRQILGKKNYIKEIQIVNRFWGGPYFNGAEPFWGNTDFNEVVAQISESYLSLNLNQFNLDLGRISLNSFCRITSCLSDNCRFLAHLYLSRTYIGDETIRFIVKAKWRYMAQFGFPNNNITSEGVKQLIKCQWKFIRSAIVRDNPLKNKGVKQLIKLNWRGLKRLNLINVGLTDDGAKILARTQWPKLILLDLTKNQFTYQAVPYLLAHNWNKLILIAFNWKYHDKKKGNLKCLQRKTNRDFMSFGSYEWKDQYDE